MQTYTFPTVETVRDQAIAEAVGSSVSSLTALQDTALIREVDRINRTFVNAAHIRHPGMGWSWMEDVTNFKTNSKTTLNGAITTASTTIDLTDASDFDTSGRLWTKASSGSIDFIDYTGKSSNQLTGVTDVDIAGADGQIVEKLYALPSDYGKTKRLIVNEQEFYYSKHDLLPAYGTFYTRGSYILMPSDIGENDCTLWYEKSPTDLSTGVTVTDDAKSLDVPDEFYRFAVEKLKAYIFRIRRKEDLAAIAETLAQEELERALSYDSSETSEGGLVTW